MTLPKKYLETAAHSNRQNSIERAILTIQALSRSTGVTASELREIIKVRHLQNVNRWIDAASLYLPVVEIGERVNPGNNRRVPVFGILK